MHALTLAVVFNPFKAVVLYKEMLLSREVACYTN